MKKITVRAPAKINFYLDILGKRKDSYHEIESLVQSVSLYDIIHLEKTKDKKIEVSCNYPALPENYDNLVYKAAKLFFEIAGITCGIRIKVEKRIPLGAGLGGGSTDAAATLLGLNLLFETDIPLPNLVKESSKLGSDVPFCILRGTAVIKGRGERVYPLPSIKDGWIVIVYPGVSVSTSWVYAQISQQLTSCKKKGKLNITELRRKIKSEGITAVINLLYNKLEEVTALRLPVIKKIKEEFKKAGARGALMSGSGSSVFGVCENLKQAKRLSEKLKGGGEVYITQPVDEKVSKEGIG
ncbi:4-(cytidine 5'-diphospho)-2-C-methyl-D-erythritol kinase [Candidatus Aerophobetes bacterium]|nr:4-(cytidine 5'-diphospho)-2-C-methyl-D-erythritol kinase [Candidatus Aerophobetes bacterium]